MSRHPLDLLSLVFGMLFAVVGPLLLGGGPALVDNVPTAWGGPIVAIGLGVILVVAARPQRESSDDDDTEPEAPSAP